MKFQATFSNHEEFSLKNMPRYHLVRPFRLSKRHFISYRTGAVLVIISKKSDLKALQPVLERLKSQNQQKTEV